MKSILKELQGKDLRSIGKADAVVRSVLNDSGLFDEIVKGMLHNDPLIRMRCADVAEKVTLKHPEYLIPYKKTILHEIAMVNQQEVRWHVAQMLPRLSLGDEEIDQAAEILFTYLEDKSNIVKVFSLQALFDFANLKPHLKKKVFGLLKEFAEAGSAAVKNRAGKLLKIAII
jgi:hypothetical protein